ncbi:IPTL-CTERM sorting domain-containing protein [Brevundimonas staleyi]|uniref:IPTL-CTERM sorting domain-containing protein n=1 Tax=Brevundimonas staleyi TaxID=74326 RepID=A0ABW0FVY0_9CAUL
MFRWILGGLFAAVLALAGLMGASSVQAQVPPRPVVHGIMSSACQASAVNRCGAGCGDDAQCIFGCQIGAFNNVDACTSSCVGFGPQCLSNCLRAMDNLQLCFFPTVGGTVSGLGSGQSVVLRNNGGAPLTVSANGAFTFPMWVTLNDAYAVTVSGQPTGQTCTVTNGSGVALDTVVVLTPYGVTDVAVTCVSNVPTMSEWGTVLLVGMLAIGGLLLLSPIIVRAPPTA